MCDISFIRDNYEKIEQIDILPCKHIICINCKNNLEKFNEEEGIKKIICPCKCKV